MLLCEIVKSRIDLSKHRGIFKPQQMQYLLSIKTIFPRPSGKVW